MLSEELRSYTPRGGSFWSECLTSAPPLADGGGATEGPAVTPFDPLFFSMSSIHSDSRVLPPTVPSSLPLPLAGLPGPAWLSCWDWIAGWRMVASPYSPTILLARWALDDSSNADEREVDVMAEKGEEEEAKRDCVREAEEARSEDSEGKEGAVELLASAAADAEPLTGG